MGRQRKRRSKKRQRRGWIGLLLGTRWGRRFVGVVNLVVLGVGVWWYFEQSEIRQEEIRRLVSNYVQQEKDIDLLELGLDLYEYYYGDQFVASDFSGKDGPLYAGTPIATTLKYNVRILENEGYVCGYSEALRSPVWVAYRLFDQVDEKTVGDRPSDFEVDRRTIAKVDSNEFTRSGYDRGHLAPNFGIARCYGREAQLGTFLMSNIIPQKHDMNAGVWRFLEERAAINYPGRFGEVWVVTGPVFPAEPKTIGNGVPIPEACFKILVDETDGKVRAQALIVPQVANQKSSLNRYLVSIDEIEQRTGLDFFTELADSVEDDLEKRVTERPW